MPVYTCSIRRAYRSDRGDGDNYQKIEASTPSVAAKLYFALYCDDVPLFSTEPVEIAAALYDRPTGCGPEEYRYFIQMS